LCEFGDFFVQITPTFACIVYVLARKGRLSPFKMAQLNFWLSF
jgi:hypothetical protein